MTIVAATYCPFDLEVYCPARTLIHGAMNQAVDVVLTQNFDYMIVFDDDCLPYLWNYTQDPRQFQAIPRLLGLLEADKADVVAGVGYMRNYPHTTTVGRLYPEGMTAMRDQKSFKGFYWLDDLEKHAHELDENKLLQADFCGMPVMAVKRKVFETIKMPAFGTRDDDGGDCTHDVYFCKKVREAGFRIRVDTMTDCGHIMPAPIVNRFTRPYTRMGAQDVERAKRDAAVGPDRDSPGPDAAAGRAADRSETGTEAAELLRVG